MLLRGLGDVLNPALTAAKKRRCASSSLNFSSGFVMAETLVPDLKKYPLEAEILGQILIGYSELEVELLTCVFGANGNNIDAGVRALYCKRGESRRIDNAVEILKLPYEKAGLARDFAKTIDDLDHCRLIRNQYAHCQWFPGLGFVALEELGRQPDNIAALVPVQHPVDLDLLTRQAAFFKYVQRKFWYLAEQYSQSQMDEPRPNLLWPKPAEIKQPPFHNGRA